MLSADRRLRVGLDSLFLQPGKSGGVETYFTELVRELAVASFNLELVVYLGRQAAGVALPVGVERRVVPVSTAKPSIRYAAQQCILPLYAALDRIDVLHSLAYVSPLWTPCRRVVTVHDLNFIVFGNLMSWRKRRMLAFFCRRSCERAAKIIAVSQFTADSMVRELGVDRDSIVQIHEAGARRVRAPRYPHMVLPSRYVAAFGGRFPNKNVGRLLEAYARICAECPADLVVIGDVHPMFIPTLDRLKAAERARVHWLGYLSDPQVTAVLSGADAYIHPSIYEGFGMPILEAQCLDTIVACSNAGSLSEIGGKGAIYFNPLSVEDMASALLRAVMDKELRVRLTVEARGNVSRFSWARTAERTYQVYKGASSGS